MESIDKHDLVKKRKRFGMLYGILGRKKRATGSKFIQYAPSTDGKPKLRIKKPKNKFRRASCLTAKKTSKALDQNSI